MPSILVGWVREGQSPSRYALALLALLALPAQAQDAPEGSGSDWGGVGLIEMRNARFRPDGTLEAGFGLRHQRNFWFLGFQALPWLETTFRLSERLNGTTGEGMVSDRSFDIKIRLWEENDWRPALAVGIQDVVGTGIYAGEYLVASKRLWDFDVSLGMGWGRLGTYGDGNNPLADIWGGFNDRTRDVGQGGTPRWGTYFRGEDISIFGGVEWSVPPIPTPWGVLEGLRAKLEVSGDRLRDERGGYPARTTELLGIADSRVNAGLQWQNDWLDVGVQYVNGTDVLFRASVRMDAANPPRAPLRPPPAMAERPDDASPEARLIAPRMFAALREAGLSPRALAIEGDEARIAVGDGRYRTLAQVVGRVVRAAQPLLPRQVERVVVSWSLAGAEVARIMVLRSAMEAAARGYGSAEEIFATATLMAAGDPFEDAVRAEGPFFDWRVEPGLRLILGDPSRTALWQAAVAAGARVEFGAGFSLAGGVAQVVGQNLSSAGPSDSLLPHVRSDYAFYADEGQTLAVTSLYAERIWSPAPDVFARATVGYLEPMFAGVSGEILYRPHDQPWGIGVDVNYVAQRDYDQRFGLQDYRVTTGQVSLYLDLPWWNLTTTLRGGRYLAGDWGGTVEVARRFDSGIEVGAFATLTSASYSDFGEGSFDKGIFIRVPLDLFGVQTRSNMGAVIRSVQRDGGQRLAVENPLWELTREGREEALQRGVAWFTR
ncbi:YjbH domain-containing protein [Roseomonas sp. HJA6]|uniref:YjbH domain-containing protein n=1 Tax=Roseomonas alba TaxID=2846776 RepID=A0ABS7A7L7_9PROT|nr:YjbH domain-containing protein [Neoroseomonas alba]MBW6398281.1 YjbH domain-containing protein [Neoroseomonas alba]